MKSVFFRVTGATIVNDTQDLREEDVGTLADLFEIKKIGDEYYTYVTSEKTTAATVLLRGPSKVKLYSRRVFSFLLGICTAKFTGDGHPKALKFTLRAKK